MIPLTDDVTEKGIAPMTWAIIVVTSVIIISIFLKPFETQVTILASYAFMGRSEAGFSNELLRTFTANFIHGDYFHLISNMIFLFAFGSSLEKRLGTIKFLILYFGSAFFGWLCYSVTTKASVPAVGASGAISGLIAAYLFAFPRAKFLSIVFILWVIKFFYIRAWLYIVIWIGIQIYSAVYDSASQVAYWAHIGGIAFGLIFTAAIKLKTKQAIGEAIGNQLHKTG